MKTTPFPREAETPDNIFKDICAYNVYIHMCVSINITHTILMLWPIKIEFQSNIQISKHEE
jgi:hypothetical protein